MKVLQICSYYLGTKLYSKFFKCLETHSFENQVYVFVKKSYAAKEALPDNVIVSPCFRSLDRVLFYPKHWKVMADIQSRMQINEFSLMHAHSLFSNGYIAYKLFKRYRIPYIVAVRNTDVHVFFEKMPLLRRLGLRILEHASKIIFISPAYLEKTLNLYVPENRRSSFQKKSIVLSNGIDEFWLDHLYEERPTVHRKPLEIIFAGTIERNKNLEATIEACKILIEKSFDVRLTAVGRIADPFYNNMISESSFVRHIPHSGKEELLGYFREADIFVMPSRTETFGLVYAEAMSQGLPIIYTKGEGFDGFFADGVVGYAVSCEDAQELAEKILRISEEFASISKRCPELCRRFNWKDIASEYNEIYQMCKREGN